MCRCASLGAAVWLSVPRWGPVCRYAPRCAPVFGVSLCALYATLCPSMSISDPLCHNVRLNLPCWGGCSITSTIRLANANTGTEPTARTQIKNGPPSLVSSHIFPARFKQFGPHGERQLITRDGRPQTQDTATISTSTHPSPNHNNLRHTCIRKT